MRKFALLVTTALLTCGALSAQEGRVDGTVRSSDGEPVIGAVVSVRENPSVAAASGVDGGFILDGVAPGQTIVATYLNFSPAEVTLAAGQTSVEMIMQEDANLIDDVVVVGYGTQRRNDVTGSISSVSGEKLRTGIATNMDQMLNGKVSGVSIVQNSGAPGAASSIRVRGTSSITGSNEPLYIIDGIPYQTSGSTIGGFAWSGGSGGQTATNPLASISPSDIVSIDILKDASATAIYGANGGNGVILVTTRRGTRGQTNISYDGYAAVQQVGRKLDIMDLSRYAAYQKSVAGELDQELDTDFGDPSLLGKGTDWQDAVFRPALQHSHQISVNGGAENVQFALSGGYMDQQGVVITSDFKRFNTRANIDATVRPWFKAGGSFAFTRSDQTVTNNDGTDGVILQSLTMNPSIPVYDFNGEYAGPDALYGSSNINPVWLATQKTNLLEKNQSSGNFYLNFDIVEGLNFRSEYGFDYTNAFNMSFVPSYELGVFSNSINQIMQREEYNSYWITKNYATYNRTFAEKHNLQLMAGFEASRSDWKGSQTVKRGLSNNDIHVVGQDGELVSMNGWKGAQTGASYFTRLNYGFDNRYLLTATFRADGSSVFGSNNKWGYFPSVALAWRVSNEAFMENVSAISDLKLRLGYGQVGNANIGNYLYGSTMTTMPVPANLGGTAYHMTNIANPNLRWEASEQYNAGIDLGLLNNRLTLTVDAYRKMSKGLLLRVSVPSYLGGMIQPPMANIGQIRNQGVDISLNSVNIVRPKFQWSSSLNVSVNRNSVLALNDDAQRFYSPIDWWTEFQTATVTMVGQPIGVFYGYTADGIFQNEAEILDSPVQVEDALNPGKNLINRNTGVYPGDIRFKDISGPDGAPDGKVDSFDQSVIGDPNPDFTFGFTNTFDYGNWQLGITLNGSVGGDIMAFYRTRTEGLNNIWDNQSTSVLNRSITGLDAGGKAIVTNPGATLPRIALNDPNRNNRMSTRWIEDGSYVRIQNISLAYNFPDRWCETISLANIKVYVNMQNLYTFTGYSGYDPEIGSFNRDAQRQNIDMGRYPSPRMFTFGVNLGF